MFDRPFFHIVTADELLHNTQKAIIMISVARCDIENCDIANTLEKLTILVDTRRNIYLYRNSVVISVDGFDNEPLELFEILKVRVFFYELNSYWPHWIWFLNLDMGSISFLLSMLLEVTVSRNPANPMEIYTDFNTNKLINMLQQLGDRSAPLLLGLGVVEDHIRTSYRLAMESL